MQLNYATIMTWMRYIQTGSWVILNKKESVNIEQEVIDKFNDLYRNELVREANSDFTFNPYRGIGCIDVYLSGNKGRMIVTDSFKYLSIFYEGIYGNINKRKLCFNKKIRGFYGEYFKFLEKEDDEYGFVENIVNGKYFDRSANIKRMINILFMRQQPYLEHFDRKDVIFWDYNDAEKKEILDECHKY